MSCSWLRIPIHSGPLLETNCPHRYFTNPPFTPTNPPLPSTIYNDNINNPGLLDPERSYPCFCYVSVCSILPILVFYLLNSRHHITLSALSACSLFSVFRFYIFCACLWTQSSLAFSLGASSCILSVAFHVIVNVSLLLSTSCLYKIFCLIFSP
jgi:hypothetical protein